MEKRLHKYLFVCLLAISCSKKTTPAVASATKETEKNTLLPSNEHLAAQGQSVYNAQCGRCHELHSPSEFTAGEWQPIMRSMTRKAQLNATDKELVMAYVSANAKK